MNKERMVLFLARNTSRTARWMVALATLMGLIACRDAKRPDGGVGLLAVGAAAPEIEGQTADGRTIHLTDVRGKLAVIYFYPQDETPGCTTEACAFRDAFKQYEEKNITVFGVSHDSVKSHADFAQHHRLPFPLVSDERGTVQQAYGVSATLGRASRVTFLVNREGKVAHVWPGVNPGTHAADVLDVAANL